VHVVIKVRVLMQVPKHCWTLLRKVCALLQVLKAAEAAAKDILAALREAEVEAIAESIADSLIECVTNPAFWVVITVIVPLVYLVDRPASAAMLVANLTEQNLYFFPSYSIMTHGHCKYCPSAPLHGRSTKEITAKGAKVGKNKIAAKEVTYHFVHGDHVLITRHKPSLQGSSGAFPFCVMVGDQQANFTAGMHVPVSEFWGNGAGVDIEATYDPKDVAAHMEKRVYKWAQVWQDVTIEEERTRRPRCHKPQHYVVKVRHRITSRVEMDAVVTGKRAVKLIVSDEVLESQQ
jgi:hypothetical protein